MRSLRNTNRARKVDDHGEQLLVKYNDTIKKVL